MARPRQIFIDPEQVLANIIAAYNARLEAIAAREQAIAAGELPRPIYVADTPFYQRRDVLAFGIEYDLPRFLGYWPTPSERIRTQEAIRALEAEGRVVRCLRLIRPVLSEAVDA